MVDEGAGSDSEPSESATPAPEAPEVKILETSLMDRVKDSFKGLPSELGDLFGILMTEFEAAKVKEDAFRQLLVADLTQIRNRTAEVERGLHVVHGNILGLLVKLADAGIIKLTDQERVGLGLKPTHRIEPVR